MTAETTHYLRVMLPEKASFGQYFQIQLFS